MTKVTLNPENNGEAVGVTEQFLKLNRINHKVEQIVRSIYWGLNGTDNLNISAVTGNAQKYFDPSEWVDIGIADHRGYRFTPASNSALITLGYHPTAVLLLLTQMRLNGKPVVAAKGDKLIALHAAVCNVAHDVTFRWDQLSIVEGKGGKSVVQCTGKPLLDNYRNYIAKNGKPKHFA